MDWISWVLVVILICIVFYIKFRENLKAPEVQEGSVQDDYSKSYQKKYLLTKNEWYEYKKLQKIAEINNMYICPKVRLLDIIEPRRGEGNYRSLLAKVQSKHVDFVICDNNLHILGILELDDNSHNSKDRKDRDAFVDQILKSVGYTVIHTRGVTEDTLDVLKATDKTV